MSRCDLEIVLERPDETFRGGDNVVGMIVVNVNADCVCRGLPVAVRWVTHGRGNRKQQAVVQVDLFQGEWKAGEEHIHPFELTLPEALAPTYHGELLNVDWEVYAYADIPWAFDPEATAAMAVTVDGGAAHDPGPRFAAARELVAAGGTGNLALVGCIFGVGALVGVAVPVGVLAGSSSAGSEGDAVVMVCSVVFVVLPIALFVLYRAAAGSLAQRRLGEVTLTGPTAPVRPGDTVDVEVRFTPTTEVGAGVVAKLVGKEVVVSGSGSNRRTHTHELVAVEQELVPHGTLPGGTEVVHTARFVLPQDAPASFEAPDNGLRWSVDVAIAVDGWPDWEGSELLHVAP